MYLHIYFYMYLLKKTKKIIFKINSKMVLLEPITHFM